VDGVPRADLHRLEAAMATALRIPLPPERALDVSATFDIIGSVVVAVVAAGTLALSWFACGPRPFIVATALMAAWIMFHLGEVFAHYRLRRARREIGADAPGQIRDPAALTS
jgi:hypothetical protein